ncbi:helix-turn-helix domain-containing protein [Rugamonas sp. DEMB1]|uniref:helix-turn-helix domain-containing protein n=1 Tax=Rugamonas sp. DEMB1 TaxID=3039386 RepID=UPI00244B64FD|nr:helix-turn-helix transcriptional regulator [Rugamonas sp. DEMB1]WGG50469.1 helix-turn-helix transcriptional regulator [Rugamonas sp. DEMB1]
MSPKFNQSEALQLGQTIKRRRNDARLTLTKLAELCLVNAAQISRFENGQFKTNSRNLQEVCGYLQISSVGVTVSLLSARFEKFAVMSEQNRRAAEQIVVALESLVQPPNSR